MNRDNPQNIRGSVAEGTLPFTLAIAAGDGQRVQVVCLEVMRTVEKTRTVYKALWGERPVIAKVFTKWGKARFHMEREWRGLIQLEARGLNTPKPLFRGRTHRGWAVVTERIENAVTARELWDRLETIEQKTSLLSKISVQLARQHVRGVLQSDLHLGNFLIRGEEVFILDPAMMHFRSREIGRRRSIGQFAVFVSILPSAAPAAIETVFNEYAAARSWALGERDREQMRYAVRRRRKSGIERGLRKFLRTNRRHQAIRRQPWNGIVERDFLKAAGLTELTVGLDAALTQGEVLKNGRTCFVSRIMLGGCDIVVKRYNHKGLLHSLRHTLKGSRARQNWQNANRLSFLGIPTPRPLAYIDEYRGPLLWRSYFITEFIEAPRLSMILRDERVPQDRKALLVERVVQLINRMAEHGITHGDMKHTNILCNGTKITLTDLDGMHVRGTGWLTRHRYRKDLARLLRDIGTQ